MLKYYYKYKYIKFSKITKKAVNNHQKGGITLDRAWTTMHETPPPKKSIYQLSKKWRYLCSKQAILFLTMYQTEYVLNSNWTLQRACQYLHLSFLLGRPNFIFGYQRNVVPSGTLASFLKVGCQLHDTSNLRKMSATKIGIATCLFLICRSNNI